MNQSLGKIVAVSLTVFVLTAAGSSARTQPIRASPLARLVLAKGYVLTDGAEVVEVNRATGVSTLTDQTSGSRTTLPALPGCAPDGLGPADVIYGCPLDLSAPNQILHVRTGQVIPTIESGTPRRVGERWAEFDVPGDSPHSAVTASFVNLGSGNVVPGSQRVGGRLYENLDSPGLLAPLCAPLRVPSFFDSQTHRDEPARVQFLGDTALFSSIAGGGYLRVQKCGSTRVARHLVGSGFVVGGVSVAWSVSDGSVDGFDIANGLGFTLDLTQSGLEPGPTIEGMTHTTLFLQQQINNTFEVRLPKALASSR